MADNEVGGSVIIKTDIDASGLVKGSKEIEAAFRQAAVKVGDIGEKARISVEKSVNSFAKMNQAYAQQSQKVEELQRKLNELGKTQVKTEAFANVEKEIDTLQQKINALVDKEERFRATGGNMDNRSFSQMEYDIERLGESLRAAQAEKERLLQSGGAYQNADVSALSNQLIIEQEKLEQLGNRLGVSYSETAAKLNDYSEKAQQAGKATDYLGESSKKATTNSSSLGSAFSSIGKNLKGIFSNAGGKLKSGLWQLTRYSLGIRSLYALFNKLRGAVKEGFQNLAQFDDGTNRSISQLQGALAQLKNATATAVAPLLNALAPALTTIINLFTRAANAVGYFLAAMTGQSTFVKATEVQKNYAASLGGTASAANKAAKAIQNLSGLDEINTLQSDSGSGGGGGGGGGAGGAGSMFETVSIPNKFKDLAELIRESWKNADFTSVGRLIGDKLKFALESIPWDKIKATAEKVAKSLATLINGFVETPGLWQTVGNTLSEGINTAVLTLNTFLKNTHFDSIGKAFSTTLQSTFTGINWKNIGNTISSVIVSGMDLVTGIIQGINWRTLPSDIANSITGVFSGFDWKKVFGSIGKLVGSALMAVIDITAGIQELKQKVINGITGYFGGYIDEAIKSGDFKSKGGAIISGIWNGIIDALKTAGTWIKDNVLAPLVGGFASAFGITGGKATNGDVTEIGNSIINGIFGKILDFMSGINNWVKDKVLTPLKNAFTGKENIGNVGVNYEVEVSGFKDKIDSSKKNISGFTASTTSFADKISSNSKIIGSMKASITTFADKLASASKVIGGVKANVTGLSNSLTAEQKKLATTAKFTSVSDALTSTQRTLSVTAKVTNLTYSGGGGKFATGGIMVNGHWQKIEGYANGGAINSARLFYANENGIPELVGRIGRNTAVLNNGQIVSSVASGVYTAVMAAFGQLRQSFVDISNNLALIPPAINSISFSGNLPVPAVAMGTVVPAGIYGYGDYAKSEDIKELKSAVDALSAIVSKMQGNTYNLTAKANGRAIFDMILQEGRTNRATYGRNPFDLL